MSNRNLSAELFRGVLTEPGQYNDSNLGQHWTSSKKVAEVFARQGADEESAEGTIFHAKIPYNSIETDTKTLENMDMFSPEKETPVKKGAPVLLTGVTTFRGNNKTRTRRYSPPRERTA